MSKWFDALSQGVTEGLLRALPPELITEVLRDQEKQAKRRGGKLPPEMVCVLVACSSLWRGLSLSNVLRRVGSFFGEPASWRKGLPHATSITHARDRLGWEAVRELFRRHAGWLSSRFGDVDHWKGYVLLAMDGSCYRAPDTPENCAWFGRPNSRKGEGGFPQLRGVALFGAFSHLVLGVAFASYRRIRPEDRVGELSLAKDGLLRLLKPGHLVLMDRGFYSYTWLADLCDAGVDWVVRVKTGKTQVKPKKRKKLGANDWLAALPVPNSLRPRAGKKPLENLRLVVYQRRGFRPVTLLTTLTDAEEVTRSELVELYHVRWEAELAFRELKAHQLGGAKVHFRSKRPHRVLQEAYGALVAYNSLRALIAEAARSRGKQPRQLSFVDCLDRTLHATVSLQPRRRAALLDDLADCALPPRRDRRSYPREVKSGGSPYRAKKVPPKAA